ncbi:hypothetical protein D9611_005466 [Ephemerocybe angulata]|uniref:Uncharacterized protein n=1 Tax=Ephemerocybe angulata TaxID=980116 RepID=A0A8H5C133_9AGAR|nr:hypothetical protein D9611_005466 [Tulosesus angulatus]
MPIPARLGRTVLSHRLPEPSTFIRHQFASLATPVQSEVYVDASQKGIGVVFRQKWTAWTIKQDAATLPRALSTSRNINIQWLEAIAVGRGIQYAVMHGCQGGTLVVRCDNKNVVDALSKRRVDLEEAQENLGALLKKEHDAVKRELCRIGRYGAKHGLHLDLRWVATEENPADRPSRGKPFGTDSTFKFTPAFCVPRHLKGLLVPVREAFSVVKS